MADLHQLSLFWMCLMCLRQSHGITCGNGDAVNICPDTDYASQRAPQSTPYTISLTATQTGNTGSCSCKFYSSALLQPELRSSTGGVCSSVVTIRYFYGVPSTTTVGDCSPTTQLGGTAGFDITLENSGGDGDEHCLDVPVPANTRIYIICAPAVVSDTVVNYCQSNSCNQRGDCTSNSDGSVTCACSVGYTGTYCEENIDFCNDTSCEHGSCYELLDGFYCRCNPGYSGIQCNQFDGFCGDQPCMNGATCISKTDDYYCVCRPGYSDKNCSTSELACDSPRCMNGGGCVDTASGGYVCMCKTGYSGSDCEAETDHCSTGVCQNEGTCIDMLNGGYSCACAQGYRGTHCQLVDTSCDPNPCLNGGTCIRKLQGGYYCDCVNEYIGSRCEIYNAVCQSYPCRNGGTCVDELTGAFHCACAGAFSGTQCDSDDRGCNSSPCLNGGTCENLLTGGIHCVCGAGYTGSQCEVTLACAWNPCERNSRCTDNPGGTYTCTCAENFTGTNCESGIYFEQWGKDIIDFSSQYDGCYGSRQILGPPDVYPNYCDCEESWNPEKNSDDYIFVGFTRALVTKVDIYETYSSGAIFAVYLRDADTQQLDMVYDNPPTLITEANIFTLEFTNPSYASDAIKVHVDSSYSDDYVDLDAIQIFGYHG